MSHPPTRPDVALVPVARTETPKIHEAPSLQQPETSGRVSHRACRNHNQAARLPHRRVGTLVFTCALQTYSPFGWAFPPRMQVPYSLLSLASNPTTPQEALCGTPRTPTISPSRCRATASSSLTHPIQSIQASPPVSPHQAPTQRVKDRSLEPLRTPLHFQGPGCQVRGLASTRLPSSQQTLTQTELFPKPAHLFASASLFPFAVCRLPRNGFSPLPDSSPPVLLPGPDLALPLRNTHLQLTASEPYPPNRPSLHLTLLLSLPTVPAFISRSSSPSSSPPPFWYYAQMPDPSNPQTRCTHLPPVCPRHCARMLVRHPAGCRSPETHGQRCSAQAHAGLGTSPSSKAPVVGGCQHLADGTCSRPGPGRR